MIDTQCRDYEDKQKKNNSKAVTSSVLGNDTYIARIARVMQLISFVNQMEYFMKWNWFSWLGTIKRSGNRLWRNKVYAV